MYSAKRNRPADWIDQSLCGAPPGATVRRGRGRADTPHLAVRPSLEGNGCQGSDASGPGAIQRSGATGRSLGEARSLSITSDHRLLLRGFLVLLGRSPGLLLTEEEHRATADHDQDDRDTRD